MAPLAAGCIRFSGTVALVILVPGLLVFAKGLKEVAARRKGP
jgi:hypothetical protein